MKVLYCQPGEDPIDVARRYNKPGRGRSGLIQYWWVGALVGFLLITFTIGPLAPKKQNAEQIGSETAPATAEIAVHSALVQAVDQFAGYCKNPAGGLFPPGATVFLTDGETVIEARCNNGTWETETEQETP